MTVSFSEDAVILHIPVKQTYATGKKGGLRMITKRYGER